MATIQSVRRLEDMLSGAFSLVNAALYGRVSGLLDTDTLSPGDLLYALYAGFQPYSASARSAADGVLRSLPDTYGVPSFSGYADVSAPFLQRVFTPEVTPRGSSSPAAQAGLSAPPVMYYPSPYDYTSAVNPLSAGSAAMPNGILPQSHIAAPGDNAAARFASKLATNALFENPDEKTPAVIRDALPSAGLLSAALPSAGTGFHPAIAARDNSTAAAAFENPVSRYVSDVLYDMPPGLLTPVYHESTYRSVIAADSVLQAVFSAGMPAAELDTSAGDIRLFDEAANENFIARRTVTPEISVHIEQTGQPPDISEIISAIAVELEAMASSGLAVG